MENRKDVGILPTDVYLPPTCVQQEAVEAFDGASKGKHTIGLEQDYMGFCTEVEDVISMRKEIARVRLNEDKMMDLDNEEEHHRNPFLSSNNNSKIVTSFSGLQCRKHISKARWNEDTMMGEIIEMKGGIWATTGIIRDGGKLYCSIEEILFLAERGALILVDAMDTVLHLADIYKKLDNGLNGCSWELFMAYRRLKSLGYIVGRHGVAWTVKHDSKCRGLSMQGQDLTDNGNSLVSVEGSKLSESINRKLNDVHITNLRLDFDVFLPNSKFKKSAPGDPFCILCIIRGYPPTRTEIEELKVISKGVPIKFCHVNNWLVNFFSYDKTELPVLP